MTRTEIAACTTDQLSKALADLAGMEHHPIYERIADELLARAARKGGA